MKLNVPRQMLSVRVWKEFGILLTAYAVLVVVVFHPGIRKSSDEFGCGFVRLSGAKQAALKCPIIGAYIDGVEGEDSCGSMLPNPLFGYFLGCENASWVTLVRRSVENPHSRHFH